METKTVNLKLIPNLPKREAKYIRVLRYLNKPSTLNELFNAQIKAFKNNSSIIDSILKAQGFIHHKDWDDSKHNIIPLSKSEEEDNIIYMRAYYKLLIYYPEYSYTGGCFSQMLSKHFSGHRIPPKNLPVTRVKINNIFVYSLKTKT